MPSSLNFTEVSIFETSVSVSNSVEISWSFLTIAMEQTDVQMHKETNLKFLKESVHRNKN